MLILIWPPLCRAVWVFSRYYHILDIKYLPVASAGKNRSGDGIRQGIFPVLNIACTLFAVCLQKALSFVKRAPLNVHLRRHRLTNVYRFIFLTSIDKSVTSDDHLSAVNCYGVKDIPGLRGGWHAFTKWVSIDYKAYYFYTINASVNSASIPASNRWSGRSRLTTLFPSDPEFHRFLCLRQASQTLRTQDWVS